VQADLAGHPETERLAGYVPETDPNGMWQYVEHARKARSLGHVRGLVGVDPNIHAAAGEARTAFGLIWHAVVPTWL